MPTDEQHDLSALDGLLGDLDIADVPTEDPRTAKLQALFEQAKATYTAKIDSPRWFVTDFAEQVPIPHELLQARKSEKNASTHQEWTVNYLYSQGRYEACLSYAASFAQSMRIAFPFGQGEDFEQDEMTGNGSGAYQKRSKEERDLSKNWGIVKDIVDAGMRCISALLRSNASTSQTSARSMASTLSIKTWTPYGDSYAWTKTNLLTLAQGFMAFAGREIRLGTGDPRYGYAGMVIRDPQTGEPSLDVAKVRLQNWTVSFGIALTLGDLALQLGYYRAAIEAHAMFLANRGLMWRVLLSLAHSLYLYAQQLPSSSTIVSEAMLYVAKAAAVSAIQSSPKQSRSQVAAIVLSGAVLPSKVLQEGLDTSVTSLNYTDEDQLLFKGFLSQHTAPPLPDEIAICLTKVVFAKKGGVIEVHDKFGVYIKEYHSRKARQAAEGAEGAYDFGEDDDATEEGPRSVRTL